MIIETTTSIEGVKTENEQAFQQLAWRFKDQIPAHDYEEDPEGSIIFDDEIERIARYRIVRYSGDNETTTYTDWTVLNNE